LLQIANLLITLDDFHRFLEKSPILFIFQLVSRIHLYALFS